MIVFIMDRSEKKKNKQKKRSLSKGNAAINKGK